MHFFFFRELQLVTLLLSISNSYTSWSIWFISLKLCVEFSIFNSFSLLLNLILFFNKKHGFFDFLTLKRHNSFQKKNNRKATHSFASRSLIFKLQQEVWKLNDICASWSSQKNWRGEEPFELIKSKIWVRHYSSIVTSLSKYLTFL